MLEVIMVKMKVVRMIFMFYLTRELGGSFHKLFL